MIVACPDHVHEDYASPEGERVLVNAGPSEAGSHEVASWLFCPRMWAYENVGEGAHAAKEPFVRGGLLHTGVGHHYIRWAIRRQKGFTYQGIHYTDPDTFYSPVEAMRVLARTCPEHERTMALELLPEMEGILTKYIEGAIIRDAFWVVEVETEHRMALGLGVPTSLPAGGYPPAGAFLHTARLDMVIRMPDGIWIWDTKTTAMTVERAVRMYRYSIQLLTLHTFGRLKWGADFRGVKIAIVPLKAPIKGVVQVSINAPALVPDMPNLIHWTRAQIALSKSIYGSNLRAYPPAGVSGSCLDPVTGGLCPLHTRCAFGL